MLNLKVDLYLVDGCGRCKLYATPQCKVHTFPKELKKIRQILNDCGLEEDLKWSMPCYTYQGKNVLMMAAFKEYVSISFFKGSLLSDKKKLLASPGENSQVMRQFRFTNLIDVVKNEDIIKSYVFEAIELEKQGKKIQLKKIEEYAIPEEFQNRLNKDKGLKKAFESLTPGRQKAYLLFFGQAKQSKTREDRITKHIPDIMNGIGLHDR